MVLSCYVAGAGQSPVTGAPQGLVTGQQRAAGA